MTDKHKTLCLTSLINREMEIKSTWDTTAHFLLLKQDQELGRMDSNWESPMGWWIQKFMFILENILAISDEVLYILTT